jgi:hypothetical protein
MKEKIMSTAEQLVIILKIELVPVASLFVTIDYFLKNIDFCYALIMTVADLDFQFRNIDHELWAHELIEISGGKPPSYECSDDEARAVLEDIAASRLIADLIYAKHVKWHEGVRMVDEVYVESEQERQDKIRFPFVNLHPRHKPLNEEDLSETLRHYNYGLIVAGTALRILTRTDIQGVIPNPELVAHEILNLDPEVVTAATHSTVERSRLGRDAMLYVQRPYLSVQHLMWKVEQICDPKSPEEINANSYRVGEGSASLFFWSVKAVIDGARLETAVEG